MSKPKNPAKRSATKSTSKTPQQRDELQDELETQRHQSDWAWPSHRPPDQRKSSSEEIRAEAEKQKKQAEVRDVPANDYTRDQRSSPEEWKEDNKYQGDARKDAEKSADQSKPR